MTQASFDFVSRDAPPPVDWTGTRTAGLARLEAFLPRAGAAYAASRNTDRGPLDRSNVSALSPWIRRRLITEEETLRACLSRHDRSSARKFIEEVLWRTYWKGWLEYRPTLYARYEARRDALIGELGADAGLQARVSAAQEGQTGIECFDAWVGELNSDGYLHNHARMWFASIWIFTLNLPWELGADLFDRRLIDADPASNTLSWRWVAGLHTPGKSYLARASNIAEHTLGRFNPAGRLNETAVPRVEPEPPPSPQAPPSGERLTQRRIALLVHEEDLNPETWGIDADIAAIGVCRDLCPPSFTPAAQRFSQAAIEDARLRSEAHFGEVSETLSADELVRWAKGLGVEEVLTAWAPVGPGANRLARLSLALAREGVRLVRRRRAFDQRAWPHATAGFFRFRERIPGFLDALGPGEEAPAS
jgi:deoxyribodipyrimidine photo-lyase